MLAQPAKKMVPQTPKIRLELVILVFIVYYVVIACDA